jgi:hypothetical protein
MMQMFKSIPIMDETSFNSAYSTHEQDMSIARNLTNLTEHIAKVAAELIIQ